MVNELSFQLTVIVYFLQIVRKQKVKSPRDLDHSSSLVDCRLDGIGQCVGCALLHNHNQNIFYLYYLIFSSIFSSVADPDPPDPHVFGPPGSGSGSISQRYGSGFGSGSSYHQAKIIRKTFIPTDL